MQVEQVAERIAAVFPDGGQVVLAEAELGMHWADVLGSVPASVWAGPAAGPHGAVAVLVALRERWVALGAARPAAAVTRGLIRLLDAARGPDHPDTLAEMAVLGGIAARAGRLDQARTLLERVWAGMVAAGAVRRLPSLALRLGELRLGAGDPTGAEVVWAEGLAAATACGAGAGPVGARLAEVRLGRGDVAGAVGALEVAWPAQLREVGAGHPVTRALAAVLGPLLLRAGRPADAVALLRPVVEAGPGPGFVEVACALVAALETGPAQEEAVRATHAAVGAAREAGGAALGGRLALAARVMMARGRVVEAEELLVEALEAERACHAEDSAEVALRQAALGRLCLRSGRPDEAVGWLEVAVSSLRRRGATGEGATAARDDLRLALTALASQADAAGEAELAADCRARAAALTAR